MILHLQLLACFIAAIADIWTEIIGVADYSIPYFWNAYIFPFYVLGSLYAELFTLFTILHSNFYV
jgi:hypothetical protein